MGGPPEQTATAAGDAPEALGDSEPFCRRRRLCLARCKALLSPTDRPGTRHSEGTMRRRMVRDRRGGGGSRLLAERAIGKPNAEALSSPSGKMVGLVYCTPLHQITRLTILLAISSHHPPLSSHRPPSILPLYFHHPHSFLPLSSLNPPAILPSSLTSTHPTPTLLSLFCLTLIFCHEPGRTNYWSNNKKYTYR